mmetsp:Transcript_61255/g.172699  ORF Transcript_61255/g.172699 Transcript_61255/m.172699 type:complete len:222 (+) Transcript_61255:255-920(+)
MVPSDPIRGALQGVGQLTVRMPAWYRGMKPSRSPGAMAKWSVSASKVQSGLPVSASSAAMSRTTVFLYSQLYSSPNLMKKRWNRGKRRSCSPSGRCLRKVSLYRTRVGASHEPDCCPMGITTVMRLSFPVRPTTGAVFGGFGTDRLQTSLPSLILYAATTPGHMRSISPNVPEDFGQSPPTLSTATAYTRPLEATDWQPSVQLFGIPPFFQISAPLCNHRR